MGMKTRLNLGVRMGMGINHWEWEGMGLKSHSRSSLIHNCRYRYHMQLSNSINVVVSNIWQVCDNLLCS